MYGKDMAAPGRARGIGSRRLGPRRSGEQRPQRRAGSFLDGTFRFPSLRSGVAAFKKAYTATVFLLLASAACHDTTLLEAPCEPKQEQSVAVLVRGRGFCPTEAIEIFLHNENEHRREGDVEPASWPSDDGPNTLLTLCRTDGSAFGAFGEQNLEATSYAVVKLGRRCPAGATEFRRYFDNEDTGNSNYATGDICPNISENDTLLQFCLFAGTEHPAERMAAFPALGRDVQYAVFAAPGFSHGLEYSTFATDDEDWQNQNEWYGDARALSIIEASVNTRFHVWTVR